MPEPNIFEIQVEHAERQLREAQERFRQEPTDSNERAVERARQWLVRSREHLAKGR